MLARPCSAAPGCPPPPPLPLLRCPRPLPLGQAAQTDQTDLTRPTRPTRLGLVGLAPPPDRGSPVWSVWSVWSGRSGTESGQTDQTDQTEGPDRGLSVWSVWSVWLPRSGPRSGRSGRSGGSVWSVWSPVCACLGGIRKMYTVRLPLGRGWPSLSHHISPQLSQGGGIPRGSFTGRRGVGMPHLLCGGAGLHSLFHFEPLMPENFRFTAVPVHDDQRNGPFRGKFPCGGGGSRWAVPPHGCTSMSSH